MQQLLINEKKEVLLRKISNRICFNNYDDNYEESQLFDHHSPNAFCRLTIERNNLTATRSKGLFKERILHSSNQPINEIQIDSNSGRSEIHLQSYFRNANGINTLKINKCEESTVKPRKLIDPKHLRKQALKKCQQEADDEEIVIDSNKTTYRLRQQEDY